ncbi:MAG: hypothetical protein ACE5D4_00335 [Thermodesulfobacteriota bacterium]
MRRPLFAISFLCMWVLLTGMSQPPQGRIPTPEIDFAATFIDDQDISTKCREVSWEGKTFLTGMRGKGSVAIPFEKVKRVLFIGDVREGRRDAQVTLRDGEVVAVTFDSESRVYGMTSYGSYQITVKNLKEILFEAAAPPQE